MLNILRQLSAFFFYLLGATFFAAFLMLRNGVAEIWSAWWLQVADLPLALTALLYAGICLYESLKGEKHSRSLALCVSVPFIALFIMILVLDFWPG